MYQVFQTVIVLFNREGIHGKGRTRVPPTLPRLHISTSTLLYLPLQQHRILRGFQKLMLSQTLFFLSAMRPLHITPRVAFSPLLRFVVNSLI